MQDGSKYTKRPERGVAEKLGTVLAAVVGLGAIAVAFMLTWWAVVEIWSAIPR